MTLDGVGNGEVNWIVFVFHDFCPRLQYTQVYFVHKVLSCKNLTI